MQPFQQADVKKNLSNKTTLELTEILTFSQDDYQNEAILIIKEILKERGLPDDEIEQCDLKYKSLIENTTKTNSQKRIPKLPKFLIWLLYLAGLAMAGYLAKIMRTALFNNAMSNAYVGWDSEYENKIRAQILTSNSLTKVPEKFKQPFCDCYIGKLKISYPKRITTDLTKNKNDSIMRLCVDSVLKVVK